MIKYICYVGFALDGKCKNMWIKVLQKIMLKNHKKISTRLLTVLTMRAIVQIEQRKRDKESKI